MEVDSHISGRKSLFRRSAYFTPNVKLLVSSFWINVNDKTNAAKWISIIMVI